MNGLIFKKKSPLAGLAVPLAAAVTLAVYLRSLWSGFVNYDDLGYVVENPFIRTLDKNFIKWAFTREHMGNWHPLTMVSYAVDFRFWGLNPAGYHLTNIVLHAVNTFLVGTLATRLYGMASFERERDFYPGILTGLVAALLFGLHPIHVESVAWVSERKDVLSGLFFMLSILAYVKYADPGWRRGSGVYYALSLVLFILALMSKPMAVTLPAVLLLLDFYPLDRLKGVWRALYEKVPFFALSAASVFLTVWAQAKGRALLTHYPLTERLAVAVRAYAFYIYKTALPVNLIPYYPRPVHPFDYVFILSLAAFAAVTLWCLVALVPGRKKIYTAVWLYYIVTLLPVVGIVQAGYQMAANRYMYIPSIGPFILIGSFVGYLSSRFAESRAIVAVSVAAALVLGLLTFRQERFWKDSISLWSRELKYKPVTLAYTGRGYAYYQEGRYAEAIEDYTVVIEGTKGRKTDDIELDEVYNKRGLAYEKRGELKQAIADFGDAVRLNPKNARALNNRGNAYRKAGSFDLAVSDLNAAVALEPGNAAIYFNLGLAEDAAGDRAAALESIRKAAIMGLPAAREFLKNPPPPPPPGEK